MLTYRIRRRALRSDQAIAATFPAEAIIRFHLLPEQPFGVKAGGGRTAVLSTPATALFDSNTGRHTIESKTPLRPLEVAITESPAHSVSLKGRVFELRGRFDSMAGLAQTIESVYFAFPWLLGVPFADPPYVERVDGEIEGSPFRWELADWAMSFETTTQERQTEAVSDAWARMRLLENPKRRRLLAALHYLHVACRLERESRSPGEFLSEVLLNLAKTLEVLFPGSGSIDTARKGLIELGYSDAAIEAHFVPVLAIRNQIDVGHVHLSVFTRDQLTVLHSYAESAETQFRQLLNRILTKVQAGEWDVPPYEDDGPRKEALAVIDRMSRALAQQQ